MAEDLSIVLAFGAGLLSFLSPCVLPLIPSYLIFIGGTGGACSDQNSRRRLVVRTLGFILGFSAVFVVMSVVFSSAFFFLSSGRIQRIITVAAGAAVIFLGLIALFDFSTFLDFEKRFHLSSRPVNVLGAVLAGAAFGAGWTPCVGPILGSILLLAGQSGSVWRAVLYLLAYSAGLGLPFLGAAFFFDRFPARAAKLRSHRLLIRCLCGFLLIAIGLIIILGRYQVLNMLFIWGEYAFIDWAQGGGPLVRFLPAVVFFCAAAIPLLIRFFRKKPVRRLLIFCACWAVLGVVQAAGFLDSAGLLARWFLYRQGV